jgi:hypothetical protein
MEQVGSDVMCPVCRSEICLQGHSQPNTNYKDVTHHGGIPLDYHHQHRKHESLHQSSGNVSKTLSDSTSNYATCEKPNNSTHQNRNNHLKISADLSKSVEEYNTGKPYNGSSSHIQDVEVSPTNSSEPSLVHSVNTVHGPNHQNTENIAHVLKIIGDKLDSSANDYLASDIVLALRDIGDSIDAKLGTHNEVFWEKILFV